MENVDQPDHYSVAKMNKEERLKRISELMRLDDSTDAPADLRKWAQNIYHSRIAVENESLLKRVVAWLQSDLASGKPAFGERSTSTSKSRHMLFRTDETAIDLRITDRGKKVDVQGQLIGQGMDDATVDLIFNNQPIVSSEAVAGRFSFGSVAKETYSIVLRSGDVEVIIEELRFG